MMAIDHRTNTKVELIEVQAQTLRIHPTAQRHLQTGKIKQLRGEMDLDALGVLHAVEYRIHEEIAIWLIDGQHRWQALMDLGLGDWVVEVLVHVEVKDDARASALFLKLNNRLSVRPYDKFENARRAGYANEVGVARIAADRNLKIDATGGDGSLRCVSALTRIYAFNQGRALAAALDTVIQAWGRTAAAVEGRILEGVGILFKNYNECIDQKTLARKLAKYPGGASGLLGDARGLRDLKHMSVARCVAEQVVDAYNAGRRTGKLDPL